MGAAGYVVLKSLALPPASLALLGLAGLVVAPWRRRLGLLLLAIAIALLGVLSMPWTSGIVAGVLERTVPPLDAATLAASDAGAIVVLGGGTYYAAPEFGGADTVSYRTLERLRYAARLQRASGLALAVTGGTFDERHAAEAVLMREVLERDFGVVVDYAEDASTNTAENARFSRRLLPFDRVVLVTHAVHVPRARRAFEDAGFSVVPAPLGYVSRPAGGPPTYQDLLPSMKALYDTHYALYELLGALWYRLAALHHRDSD